MTFAHNQKGLSLLGWLLALALVAFLASTAFKLIPHYIDYLSLEKIIASADAEKTAGIQGVGDFYSHVHKGMQVNGINQLDLQKALTVKVENPYFHARLQYEKREPLIGNLDLVVRFDKEFRVRVQ